MTARASASQGAWRRGASHIVTVPLFWLGLLSLGAAVILGWRFAFGAVGVLVALIAQGRGHEREHNAPLPFRGPSDVLARFVCEQVVTFPRYVLSGGWSSAWRAAQRKT